MLHLMCHFSAYYTMHSLHSATLITSKSISFLNATTIDRTLFVLSKKLDRYSPHNHRNR